jgi:hypothetical protein
VSQESGFTPSDLLIHIDELEALGTDPAIIAEFRRLAARNPVPGPAKERGPFVVGLRDPFGLSSTYPTIGLAVERWITGPSPKLPYLEVRLEAFAFGPREWNPGIVLSREMLEGTQIEIITVRHFASLEQIDLDRLVAGFLDEGIRRIAFAIGQRGFSDWGLDRSNRRLSGLQATRFFLDEMARGHVRPI